MTNPTDKITVTMTREELEEIAASELKEYMEIINEARHTLKDQPGNAYRRIGFVSRELDRLNEGYIKSLCTPIELEAV